MAQPICGKCFREMSCQSTGVVVHYQNGHCRSGDVFECVCGTEVVVGLGSSYQHSLIKYDEAKPDIQVVIPQCDDMLESVS